MTVDIGVTVVEHVLVDPVVIVIVVVWPVRVVVDVPGFLATCQVSISDLNHLQRD